MTTSQQPVAKARYAPFLLVMLILSSIVTTVLFIAAFGTIIDMASAPSDTLFGSLRFRTERDAFYWVSSTLSIIIAFGSAAALALLWLKKKAGILLKFSLLGLTLVNMFVALGVKQHASYGKYLRSSTEFNNGVMTYGSGPEAIVFIIIGAIFLGGIATLWTFAWIAQQKHDGRTNFLSSK